VTNLQVALADFVYAPVVSWRRRWYAHDPARVGRLDRPVVSVGNLRVGGTGKTPVVAHLARLLVEAGEHPAILSRGYARRKKTRGVTVVSDRSTVLAPLDLAGDEPLLLARMLPGVPVLVGGNRRLAGQVAERQLGTTVHILDDGFQHLALGRDVDLLIVEPEDLTDRVLPAGRLREPLDAAAAADALLTTVTDEHLERLRASVGLGHAFTMRRGLGAAVWLDGTPVGRALEDGRVVAVAGIARPERFFQDLDASGWRVVRTLTFRDHHPFTTSDVERIERMARAEDACIVTTAKDAVRLERVAAPEARIAVVPVAVTIEPAERFTRWLIERVRGARDIPSPPARLAQMLQDEAS
jgi:tetraacyldisaccharide 4'-kinase